MSRPGVMGQEKKVPQGAQEGRPAGLILAGGKGKRLGGGGKAMTLLKGQPLLEHVYEHARPQISACAVASGGKFLSWRPDVPRLHDGAFMGCGPLAGIIAGLSWIERTGLSHWLQTFPCDTPFLPCDLTARLMAARQDTRPVVPETGGQKQNLLALWHVSHRPLLEEMVRADKRAVWMALEALDAVKLPWSSEEAGAFVNVNDPRALQEAGARL